MNRLLIVCLLFSLIGCSRVDAINGNVSDGRTGASKSSGSMAAYGSGLRAAMPTVARASFADLPDRGELLVYGSPLRADQVTTGPTTRVRGAYTWHRVAISEDHALRAIVDGRLQVLTPSGERLEVLYDHHVEHPSGDLSWVGHIKDRPEAQTILTFGAKAVYGTIGRPGKRELNVTTEGGAAWLIETDAAKLVGISNAGATPRGPDYLKVPQIRPRTESFQGSSLLGSHMPLAMTTHEANSTAATPVTIDLLIGYTQGYAPETGVTTRLNNLVQTGNQALANSKVNVRIRLVHSMRVSYSDTTTNDSTLEQLTGYDESEQRPITPHAAFKALRAAREQYGADLVTLIRPFRDPEQGSCGVAWLIGSGRSPVAHGDGSDYFGYSVVSDGMDGAALNFYRCVDHTLIHEIGHNMGSQHDRGTAVGDDGKLDPDEYGAFTYSFGYKASVSAGNFSTVMAYGEEGQDGALIFSNPRTSSFCGDYACGSAAREDNARSLGRTAPVIAAFRPARRGKRSLPRNDIDGDRKSDLLFHYASSAPGKFQYWIMNGATRERFSTSAISSGYTVAATGDFNGDGKGDLVWTNASRTMSMWLGDGNKFKVTILGTFAQGWELVGAGDIDGDGRSDLLFHNSTTNPGKIQYWIMHGTQRVRFSTFNISSGYKLSATGDFNGDGKLDLLWTNAARKMSMWLGNGTKFSVTLMDSYGAGWVQAGASDVNGDGRSDLLFHYRSSNPGKLQYWVMNGATREGFATVAITRGYNLASVGDFNGDGKGDLLWVNSARKMSMWLSNGVKFSVKLMDAYGADWVVVK